MSRPSKLSTADVVEIRRRYSLHIANAPKRIAAEFGITHAYVHMIANGVHPRCPPLPSKSPIRRSPSTSGPKTMNT